MATAPSSERINTRRALGGGPPEAQALGRSRGGFSTKVHLRAEKKGLPVTLVLTPGQHHEQRAFVQLMEQGSVRPIGPGRPKKRPRRFCGDKGYSGGPVRRYLRRHRIAVTIPRKADERRRGPFDREIYRQRHRIECLINKAKQNRRIATRYEKLGANYRAMWLLAFILLWLPFANTP